MSDNSDRVSVSSVRDQCTEVLQFVCHDWGNRRLVGERRRPAGAPLASTDPFMLLVAMQQHQQRAQVSSTTTSTTSGTNSCGLAVRNACVGSWSIA